MSCCIVDMDPVKQNKIITPKIRLSKKARLDFAQPNFQSMSGYVMHNLFRLHNFRCHYHILFHRIIIDNTA